MSDVQDAIGRLDAHKAELDKLSRRLAAIQVELEPVEIEYQKFIDDYEIGLYLESESPGGKKLPSEVLRRQMARRAMRPELLGARDGLIRRRERIKDRISDLKTIVGAERSILSAEKEAVA